MKKGRKKNWTFHGQKEKEGKRGLARRGEKEEKSSDEQQASEKRPFDWRTATRKKQYTTQNRPPISTAREKEKKGFPLILYWRRKRERASHFSEVEIAAEKLFDVLRERKRVSLGRINTPSLPTLEPKGMSPKNWKEEYCLTRYRKADVPPSGGGGRGKGVKLEASPAGKTKGGTRIATSSVVHNRSRSRISGGKKKGKEEKNSPVRGLAKQKGIVREGRPADLTLSKSREVISPKNKNSRKREKIDLFAGKRKKRTEKAMVVELMGGESDLGNHAWLSSSAQQNVRTRDIKKKGKKWLRICAATERDERALMADLAVVDTLPEDLRGRYTSRHL